MGTQDAAARPEPRRSDADRVRLQQRDLVGLLLCAEHYAAPYDLLAAALGASPARLRGITTRWRGAGYAQLAALQAATPTAMDPTLLDEIPYAGDILPDMPPALKDRLFAAFDITILWNKPGNQTTVRAVLTDATVRAVPDILNLSQDGYHDTATTTSTDTPLGRTSLSSPFAQSTRTARTGAGG
jgi:hypothetical protein